jgi:hypothetical protein
MLRQGLPRKIPGLITPTTACYFMNHGQGRNIKGIKKAIHWLSVLLLTWIITISLFYSVENGIFPLPVVYKVDPRSILPLYRGPSTKSYQYTDLYPEVPQDGTMKNPIEFCHRG